MVEHHARGLRTRLHFRVIKRSSAGRQGLTPTSPSRTAVSCAHVEAAAAATSVPVPRWGNSANCPPSKQSPRIGADHGRGSGTFEIGTRTRCGRAAKFPVAPRASQDGELLSRIREYTGWQAQASAAVAPAADGPLPLPQTAVPSAGEGLPGVSENFYGGLIRFRSLEHAPINEQGVIFLFGMICKDLGYVVEMLKPGFPDCEGCGSNCSAVLWSGRMPALVRNEAGRLHQLVVRVEEASNLTLTEPAAVNELRESNRGAAQFIG